MAEEKDPSASGDQNADQPSKPMSKLDQLRAAAKAKAAGEGESSGGESAPEESKPKSKLEQLRAAAKTGGAGASQSKLAAAGGAGGAKKADSTASKGAGAGAKAPAPPMPKRPATPAKAKTARQDARRTFFGIGAILVVGWVAFSAACAAALAGTVRFMFPNVLTEPPSKFKIGSPGDYPPDSVSTKWKAQFGVWVVNTTYDGKQEIYVLRTVCTHLGCTPNWLDAERKFKCPCHGSGFYLTGINFEGPAPRPLERHAIRLAEDGQLEVDKSRLFQQELGQWEDPASYVVV